MSCSKLVLPSWSASRLGFALLPLAFAPFAAAQGAVLVVDDDGGPGVDFTSVADAVQAAQDGDTVLVREGHYPASGSACSIVGKSLVVTAEAGAEVVIEPSILSSPLHISGLAAHQEVLLRGLSIEVAPGAFNASIFSNEGSVRLEECVFRVPEWFTGSQWLHVVDSDAVVLTRCEIRSQRAGVMPVVLVQGSGFSCYDTRIVAGSAKDPLLPGGRAVQASGSRLFLSGGRLQGGDGGDGIGCSPWADGGDALVATDCDVFLRDTVLAGGSPGVGLAPACAAGQPGEPFALTGGTFESVQSAPPRLDASPLVREGHFLRLTFDAPGKQAFALFSQTAATIPVLPAGELLVADPLVLSVIGAIPAHGLTLHLPLATLPAGIEATYHFQGAFVDPLTGAVELGNATSVTLLAAGL